MNRDYSSIRLEITSKCNLKCLYCHNEDYSDKEDDMSTEEIIKLIKDMKKVYPINKILLTGGEPLINKDIVKIVEEITKLGIKSDLVTNGKLLNKRLANDLINAGLKRIRLSIDGFEEHSLYRIGSDHKELWEKAEYLVNRGDVNVCIHTVASPHNVNNLFKIYKKILEIGVDRWRVFDLGLIGGVIENGDDFNFINYYDDYVKESKKIIEHQINTKTYKDLDIALERMYLTEHLSTLNNVNDLKKKTFEERKEERLDLSPCDYVSHQITIRSNGKATLCQYFHDEVFDLKDYNKIENAFNNKREVLENDLKAKELERCNKCKYFGLCEFGCRSKALILTGDIRNPDPTA